MHYENSYFEFMKNNKPILDWLINTAKDVYDNDISNINSKTDYSIQETKSTHIQDIAVRRVIQRMNLEFKGQELIQIRGKDSRGYMLNPGKIPFYKPEFILKPERNGWWDKDSIEDFWQSNKIILLERHYLNILLDDEVLNCPKKKYSVDEKELTSLELHWCTIECEDPSIYGIGRINNEEYYICIRNKLDTPEYMSRGKYFSDLIKYWKYFDLIIRASKQLPRYTIKKIRKYCNELIYLN